MPKRKQKCVGCGEPAMLGYQMCQPCWRAAKAWLDRQRPRVLPDGTKKE